MDTTTTTINATAEGYHPKFAIYHPNAKGTGCALKMDLRPAHDNHDGCIMMCMAPQKTIGSVQGGIRRFPTFDWEKRICIKLDFSDLCKMIQVFRGETESLDDGKGLFHRSAHHTTRIVFRHIIEPVHGYSLEAYSDTPGNPDETRSARILINPWEATGIGIALENSIGVICFGIPRVIGHDRTEDADEGESYGVSA